MTTVMFVLFGLSIILYIAMIINAIVGDCSLETEYTDEVWGSKVCEKIHYTIIAPASIITILFQIIGAVILGFLR